MTAVSSTAAAPAPTATTPTKAAVASSAASGSGAAPSGKDKVTAFQLALQAALQAPPVLGDGGGTDDDNDDGTSLSIRRGTGFPMP